MLCGGVAACPRYSMCTVHCVECLCELYRYQNARYNVKKTAVQNLITTMTVHSCNLEVCVSILLQ